MNIRPTIIGIFLLFVLAVEAQQWNQASLSIQNKYRDFAAYAGLDRKTTITGMYRSQWAGIGQNPTTQYFGIHSPVYVWNGAVGMDLSNMSEGVLRIAQLRASYNFVYAGMGGLWSFGGRLGMQRLGIDGQAIRTPDGSYVDGMTNHNDPRLSAIQENGIGLLWEASAIYYKKQWLAGISVQQFPDHRLVIGPTNFRNNPTVSALFEHILPISKELSINSYLLARTNMDFVQTELGAALSLRDLTFGSAIRGYSSNSIESIHLLFGYQISQVFSFYYAYDAGLSGLRRTTEGSHELVLRYTLNKLVGKGLKPKIIYNPRFL